MTHSALTCCYNNTRNTFKETKSHWFTDRNWSHTVCTSVRWCTPHGRPIKLSGTVRYIYFSNFKQHTQNIYINSYIGVRNIFRKLKSDHLYRVQYTKKRSWCLPITVEAAWHTCHKQTTFVECNTERKLWCLPVLTCKYQQLTDLWIETN